MQLDQDTCTPLFEQCAVRHKMSTFHSKLMSLESHRCSTCLECFPDLSMAAGGSTECTRCSHDKHIPKLYTTANNMNPGTVPPQLQVYSLFAGSITCIFNPFICRGYPKWRRCLSLLSCQICQFIAYCSASMATLVMSLIFLKMSSHLLTVFQGCPRS